MRMSRAFIQTLRENPRDADIVSQQLFLRGNLIKKHGAGLYSYLPLLVKSYHKLCKIVRDELGRAGWQEVIMPFVTPSELWKETGRWSEFEGLMLQLKDRKEGEYALGPTHEEIVTDIVRSQVNSYKQLPVTLYQITPKFRDEIRPRFGLMRAREFVMMDAYSFHVDSADLDREYEVAAAAYRKIFDRIGLKYVAVEADTGAIGGSASHEFQVLAETGEDLILYDDKGYAANVERAETPRCEQQKLDWGTETSLGYKEVPTPGKKTIEEVSAFLNVPAHRNIKTLVYRFNSAANTKEYKALILFVCGHRQLNEAKLRAELGRRGVKFLELSPMPEADVEKLFSCAVGYLGPVKAPEKAMYLYDREVLGVHDAVAGANKEGFHLQHLEPARDFLKFKAEAVADIVFARVGELSPKGAPYKEARGIEVGHIFKLGDKYSKAMKAQFQDANKQSKVMQMGCYGIGVSRILAAAMEQNHDDDGMIWIDALAPYDFHLVNLQPDDSEVSRVSELFYSSLQNLGFDVLYDDRDLSPGVKFKDADLLGMPRRLVFGKRGLDQNEVEFVIRRGREKKMLKLEEKSEAGVKRFLDDLLNAT